MSRRGARVVNELRDDSWGERTWALDLKGHHWWFSEPIREGR
jgi:uncharacterized glyoxalase superfamily protein PhnB